MQLDKPTKLLKLVWKAIAWTHLVVLAAAIFFLSQFFSFDVFLSNFHRQATAADSAEPR